MGFGNQFAVQKSSTRRVACGPRPAVSNCNKSSTESIGQKRYSGLRQYRFLFDSFRFGGFWHLKEEDHDGHKGGGA